MKTISCILLIATLAGCKDAIVDPPPAPVEQWEQVKELRYHDVRSMLVHKDVLYITSNKDTDSGNYGYLHSTTDAKSWKLIRSFRYPVGPMVFNGDTLIFLTQDSVVHYYPNQTWKAKQKLPFIGTADVYDIFYLNGTLFIMDVRLWKLNENQTFQELYYPQRGGKFLVQKINEKEVAYFRPWIFAEKFYWFDGSEFFEMTNGLTQREKESSTVDALTIKNDTLFAGFSEPGSIKYYAEERWQQYSDTLPYSSIAFYFSTPLATIPTAITFANGKLYVGTNSVGVLLWDDHRWNRFSTGLPLQYQGYDFYHGINFLKYIKGVLVTGFGEPMFSPYYSKLGVYSRSVK